MTPLTSPLLVHFLTISSSSEYVVTHPVKVATIFLKESNNLRAMSAFSAPIRYVCSCSRADVMSFNSVRKATADFGASFRLTVRSYIGLPIRIEALIMPTTADPIARGSIVVEHLLCCTMNWDEGAVDKVQAGQAELLSRRA